MIAIVTDKFKGTLTGKEVADIIAQELPGCVYIPMADGGEGTAEALGAVLQEGYYTFIDHDGVMTGYVPSCGEGMNFPNQDSLPLRERSSAPVGEAVAKALKTLGRVYVGIGGTRTADGGLGFAAALKDKSGEIIGLADVQAPLLATEGISAVSFLAQKGATREDMDFLSSLYRILKNKYRTSDCFGGAGGGIGFAIESILKQKVISGADYILRRNIEKYLNGVKPDLLITGEGCIDAQTRAGKVVDSVYKYGKIHGIPVVAFAGITSGSVSYPNVFPTTLPGQPMPNPAQAAENLHRALIQAIPTIKKLINQ